jgi:hypothetical protein
MENGGAGEASGSNSSPDNIDVDKLSDKQFELIAGGLGVKVQKIKRPKAKAKI